MKARLTCHSLLALSIAALLPAGSALAATTSGGTVNFSGKVVTSACAISAALSWSGSSLPRSLALLRIPKQAVLLK